MAIFTSGFETGDFTEWTGTGGPPTIDADPVHHGNWSMFCDWAEYVYKTIDVITIVYARLYINFTTLPLDADYAGFLKIGSYERANIRNNAGNYEWGITDSHGVDHYDTIVDANTGQWYCVELFHSGNNGADADIMYVDGVSVATGEGNAAQTVTDVRCGRIIGDIQTLNIDCVVVDSAYIGLEGGAPPAVTNKGGSNVTNTMMQMLNSKMLFSACNRFPKLSPRHF